MLGDVDVTRSPEAAARSKVLELKRARKELNAKMGALAAKPDFNAEDEKSFLNLRASPRRS